MRIVKNGSVLNDKNHNRIISTSKRKTVFHVWGGSAPRKTYVLVRNSKKGHRDAELFLINAFGDIRMDVAASGMTASQIAYEF